MKNNRISSWYLISFLVIILLTVGVAACSAPPVATQQIISAEQAIEMIEDGAFLLDVRTPEEYKQAHIPGSTLIPLDTLVSRANELPEDETIVIYCRSGNRSLQAVNLLEQAGFTNVHSMDQGINYWIAQGYEVVR